MANPQNSQSGGRGGSCPELPLFPCEAQRKGGERFLKKSGLGEGLSWNLGTHVGFLGPEQR